MYDLFTFSKIQGIWLFCVKEMQFAINNAEEGDQKIYDLKSSEFINKNRIMNLSATIGGYNSIV